MPYLKINGDNRHYPCAGYSIISSQHGKSGIRFATSTPLPESDTEGFKYYSDNDELLYDMSEFKYFYELNIFTVEKDEIELPTPNNTAPPSSPDRYSDLSRRIDEITPYTETKIAYIDETEIIFTSDKEGKVLVSAIDSYGDSVDALVERENEKITVSFLKPIESVTKVTISIQ